MDPAVSSHSLPASAQPDRGAARSGAWPLRILASTGNVLAGLLTSVKFGIFLLVVLALGAIAGTFIESYVGTPDGTPTAQRLVYHAWWYIAVMTLLAITLNAASWPHYVRTWNLPRMRALRRDPAHFTGLPVVREIAGPLTAERLRAQFERRIGPRIVQDGNALFAQRGIIQRWGFIVTHAGMTLLLAGSVFLSVMAHFQGPPGTDTLWVGEGMARDWIYTPVAENPDLLEPAPLPFAIRLHDFDADFFPGTNVPRFFGSYVELIDASGKSSFHHVTMNEALRWRGWKFSQNSYAILDSSLEPDQAQQFARMDGPAFADLRQRGRLAIRLVDNTLAREFPQFDAAPGVRVPVPNSDLEFETLDGRSFHILRAGQMLAHGTLRVPGVTSQATAEVTAGPWSIRVDNLYPDYQRTEQGPVSRGSAMRNPAITYTLLRGENEIGSDTAFLAPEFRDMYFADLPLRARFLGHEPASAGDWTEGQAFAVRLALVDASGASLETVMMEIGETRRLTGGEELPAPDPHAFAGSADTSAQAFDASVSGRLPAAYSVFGVMRESDVLKIFFYLSFVLFGLGPYIAFASRHWQVWAWVAPDGSRALVGGRARGRRATLPAMLDQMKRDLEAPPEESHP
ncbi:MAG: cytochrome c biogenesis protein ResB [Candidatus Sumerlaeia bacterium]|nr:cytochrome c biogenesis protein ResB [Candidatus Sumerlaeia bacterium]